MPNPIPCDVAIYEAFAEEADGLRRRLPSNLGIYLTPATIQEAGHEWPPARLISIRTQSFIPAKWAPRLQGVLSRSAGYDHLRAFLARAARPVACGYLPDYCARAVAEHALLLWLALLRRLPLQLASLSHFNRDGLTGREGRGRTLAVFGVGRIGREIARIGAGLEMNVLGVDLVRRHAEVHYVEPDEALEAADVIVCAMNLTAGNRGYFGRPQWEQVRIGAVFVNIARGELAPTRDLAWALDQGRLAAAGLDVYEEEAEIAGALRAGTPTGPAPQAMLELARRPNVLLTPHNAFNTEEAVARKTEQAVRQILHFRETGRFLWPIPSE